MNVPPRHGEADRGAKRRGGGAHHPHVPPIVETARRLRREMSYPEVLLWQRLRRAPMGLRFRRNHPVGLSYSADFFCAAARLVIEVDGKIHDQPGVVTRDRTRDEFMSRKGLRVVRVPASDVLRNADDVAASILSLAAEPLHHRLGADGPPPRAGEELR